MPDTQESPEYVRLSLAAAMQLRFHPGRFYRGARMTCINLLLTYGDGCAGNCSYCGLSRERKVEGDPSFIRVPWPTLPFAEVVSRIAGNRVVKRTCISMITNRRSVEDTLIMARRLREETAPPVSALIAPTLMDRDSLEAFRKAGVDRIGIAFDASTQTLFDAHRGQEVKGPHRWDKYWKLFEEAVDVFGRNQVGSHFIVGLGETEKDLVEAFGKVRDRGGVNHLFSFYPESGSELSNRSKPPLDAYRRIQIACELIDKDLSSPEGFTYTAEGRILGFGVSREVLDRVIRDGNAFRTRGCMGEDGEVACNRPFANSPPGEGIRNFPFKPDANDIQRIREQLDLQPEQQEKRAHDSGMLKG